MWSRNPIPELTAMVCELDACVACAVSVAPGVASRRVSNEPPSSERAILTFVSFVLRLTTAVRGAYVCADIFSDYWYRGIGIGRELERFRRGRVEQSRLGTLFTHSSGGVFGGVKRNFEHPYR